MITTHVESFAGCLAELMPLFEPHYRELALDQAQVPLDPDWSYYERREAAGELLLVTVRDRSILGYFLGVVAPHPHYQSTLTLSMDVFWLHPDLRSEESLTRMEANMTAEQLFETVKDEAQRRGVQRAFFGSKWHQDASALFEKMGMVRADVYYSAWWGRS